MTYNNPKPANGLDTEGTDKSQIDFLVERDRLGKFLMENFGANKTVGVFEFKEIKQIRPTLDDLNHLTFLNIITHSILHLSPGFIRDDYKLGKLFGYFSAQQALSALELDAVISPLRKNGLSLDIIENEKIQEMLRKGWEGAEGGILEFNEIDKKNRRILYTMKETASSIIGGSGHTQCYFELGILCGQMEYLLGGNWDGIERNCIAKGDPLCLMELFEQNGEIRLELPVVSSKEEEILLDKYLSVALSKEKDLKREHLKNFSHISLSQSFNYLFLSRSAGHRVLMKYGGKKVGGRIAKSEGLKDVSDSLEYLKNLFLDLKVGVLDIDYDVEGITIQVEESVFSAGVSNIGMKLCIFLGGIIEGCLNTATGVRWIIDEDTCTANGNENCKFLCKTQDPEILEKLLLGG